MLHRNIGCLGNVISSSISAEFRVEMGGPWCKREGEGICRGCLPRLVTEFPPIVSWLLRHLWWRVTFFETYCRWHSVAGHCALFRLSKPWGFTDCTLDWLSESSLISRVFPCLMGAWTHSGLRSLNLQTGLQVRWQRSSFNHTKLLIGRCFEEELPSFLGRKCMMVLTALLNIASTFL